MPCWWSVFIGIPLSKWIILRLQSAKQRREDIGVDLYGFQQHLDRLHTRLAAARQSAQEVAGIRAAADEQIASLHNAADASAHLTAKQRSEVGKHCTFATGLLVWAQ